MFAEHLAAEARSPDICSIQCEGVEIARLVIRRKDGTTQGSHPISSSSAGPSATHGDPRLPNLKRRLPEKQNQKNSTEDKSHSENDKFLGPRAERQSLGGNKGSAVYSTPTVIEL